MQIALGDATVSQSRASEWFCRLKRDKYESKVTYHGCILSYRNDES